MTASAPRGTGAPVIISHTAPRGSGPAGGSPARLVPAMASGRCVEASAARHANPSRVERAKGGWSLSARRVSASTRPAAAAIVTRSVAGLLRARRAARLATKAAASAVTEQVVGRFSSAVSAHAMDCRAKRVEFMIQGVGGSTRVKHVASLPSLPCTISLTSVSRPSISRSAPLRTTTIILPASPAPTKASLRRFTVIGPGPDFQVKVNLLCLGNPIAFASSFARWPPSIFSSCSISHIGCGEGAASVALPSAATWPGNDAMASHATPAWNAPLNQIPGRGPRRMVVEPFIRHSPGDASRLQVSWRKCSALAHIMQGDLDNAPGEGSIIEQIVGLCGLALGIASMRPDTQRASAAADALRSAQRKAKVFRLYFAACCRMPATSAANWPCGANSRYFL